MGTRMLNNDRQILSHLPNFSVLCECHSQGIAGNYWLGDDRVTLGLSDTTKLFRKERHCRSLAC